MKEEGEGGMRGEEIGMMEEWEVVKNIDEGVVEGEKWMIVGVEERKKIEEKEKKKIDEVGEEYMVWVSKKGLEREGDGKERLRIVDKGEEGMEIKVKRSKEEFVEKIMEIVFDGKVKVEEI